MMKVLLIGAGGQLGRSILAMQPDICAWFGHELNFLNPQQTIEKIVAYQPTHIINATAYTAVDQAEDEPQQAWAVNCEGPHQLATAALECNATLIHVSTDYVFDGSNEKGNSVLDHPNPISVYGRSKYAGELAIECHLEKRWIIRTSWLFSQYQSNFVKTMLRLASEREELSIVNDQIGSPTHADDLSRVCLGLTESKAPLPKFGTYHLSGGAACSWFEFAQEIFANAVDIGLIQQAPRLRPIDTASYPTRAARPKNSVLIGSPELIPLTDETPDWKRGLQQTLRKLKEQ